MQKRLEYALRRKLTDREAVCIKKLEMMDHESKETLERMFEALFRAGQVAAHQALIG